MATGGALALAAGYAQADSDAKGVTADSPGLISGNTIQLPVDVPVNICGNTVNVVGVLNPAAGNKCENKGGGHHHKDRPGTPHGEHGGKGSKSGGKNGGGASADGAAVKSPGVISGNGIQLPIDLPVNVSGNSVSLVGILNPTFGNASSNGGSKPPATPQKPQPQKPKPQKPRVPVAPPEHEPAAPQAPTPADRAPSAPLPRTSSTSLAETGAGAGLIGIGVPAAMGLMIGGGLLYRRFRPASSDRA